MTSTTQQGFILYPKYDEYPQPVPYANLPTPAGTLPSWEQKKLEMDMGDASLNSQSPVAQRQSPVELQSSNPTSPTAPPTTQSSLRRRGSAFLSSFRSPSSATGGTTGAMSSNGDPRRTTSLAYTSSNTGTSRSGTAPQTSVINGTQIHFDEDGGIGNSPRRNSNRRSNILAYLKKHFSIQNHPEYTPSSGSSKAGIGSVPTVPSAQTEKVKPNTLKKSPSQKLANGNNTGRSGFGGNQNRKTRSTAFAEKMKATSGKMTNKIQQTWHRLNSKSSKEELPKTWAEWQEAYASGRIDISDLPDVPPREQGATEETPFESEFLPAPTPTDQRKRQLAINRLDYEGKRGIKPSEIAVPEGEDNLPDTLDGHPAFRDIVSKARETFDSAIAIITVFNENRQLFLAETGLGGMKEVPREVSFCSHAVLQKPPEPFVLNDTHRDWRFAKSPLVQQYGCRAYYGVPLLAPDFSGSSDDPVPIGTLCVIDDKPRPVFTPEQKQKMNDLALLAQKTIANWSRARLRARLDAMERSFQLWKNEAAKLGAAPAALSLYQDVHNRRYIEASHSESPTTHVTSQESASAGKASPDPVLYIAKPQEQQPHQAQSNGEAERGAPEVETPGKTDILSSDSFHTAPVSLNNKQKIYDISTRLVGDSLELTLVYLLRLNLASERTMRSNPNPEGEDSSVKSISLVSSFGLPSPEPAFDAVLHMKALRSEEGGLLYQNPRVDELREGERLPQNEEVEYASALLVPVCESESSGYVLAGFTEDPDRVFERSDLEYMTTIASELAIYLME